MMSDAARESASQAKKAKKQKETAAKKAAAEKKAEAKKQARLASSSFCLTQSWQGRCTITSVAMMLRRAVYLDGSKSWKEVTEASTAADGWVGGVGVKFTFKSAGHTVTKRALKTSGSGAERVKELKALLAKHPEGIAIYDPGVPHAILLSGYDEKTKSFTCADPAQGYAGKQVSIGETWNAAVRGSANAALAGFSEYWVVSA